jgi:hypothetical protein
MKKLSLITISAIAVTTLVFSCKKDRIETPEQLTAYEPINTYLDQKKQPEQDFLITGPSNDTIIGNQGTKIYGAKNCLRDANNDTIDYPFNVKLVELYTPKDMIYWQMPTMGSGNALNSDGEIRVRAVKNNVELTLASSCPFAVEMPNGSPASTKTIYSGNDNGTFVDWINTSTPFSTTTYGYKGFVNNLGWISCAEQVATGGNKVSFTSTTDDLTNVGIFIFIPATKTLAQGYNKTVSGIPNGSSVKIVLMAQDNNGDLFSYTKTRTISGNTSIDVSLSPTTDAALTSHLNGL